MIDYKNLMLLAESARENAYVPYSGFKVGAALITTTGKIYTGCNIENASYTPTNCAERTAFFKAVSEGHRHFSAIAVSGGYDSYTSEMCMPCGVCRQVMAEFCNEDFRIITGTSESYKVFTLSELLPLSFSKDNLDIKK